MSRARRMPDPIVLHEACRRGDLEALKAALGDPPDFPNSPIRRAFPTALLD
jgi:hypothetical protein